MMRSIAWLPLVLVGLVNLAGCSLNDMVAAKPPATVLGREITRTEAGADAILRSAMTQFASALNGSLQTSPASTYVLASGVFTDEFLYLNQVVPAEFDRRLATGSIGYRNARDAVYSNMQYARVSAQLARQAMGTYGTGLDPFYRGIAMVTEAYAIMHLAEFFCSGLPLSDASLDGDVHYRAGLPTDSLFARAVLLLDSALALHTDSTRLFSLARVAKGRALLSLGRYAEAAEAASGVTAVFVYSTEHNAQIAGLANTLGRTFASPTVHIPNTEGGNGINWTSPVDPRMKSSLYLGRYTKPDLYPNAGSPTVLASATEARLIEAEGALARNDASWLQILNAIRTNGDTLPTTAACPAGVARPCPAAGSGGVAGLPPLQNPGTPEARIRMLFRERGFWLYATGHRQGDLRRLVRVYGWPQSQVYPDGTYTNVAGGTGAIYGDIVAQPVADAERRANPRYTGCLTLTQ